MRYIEKLIVHCSDSRWGDAEVIDQWHKERGWTGCGYHVVINNGHRKNSTNYDANADGLLQMGRPLEKIGAHCRGHNKSSLGICLIGIDYFTPNQYYKLRQLIDVWRDYYKVSDGMIRGHRDFQATSGGKKKTCPNFDVSAWLLPAEIG